MDDELHNMLFKSKEVDLNAKKDKSDKHQKLDADMFKDKFEMTV